MPATFTYERRDGSFVMVTVYGDSLAEMIVEVAERVGQYDLWGPPLKLIKEER